MGAWGVGPLDNDAALDLLEAWKRFRSGGYPEGFYTPEGTFDHFVSAGVGNTMDWGDIETTARLLALAELFLRDGLAIRGKVKEYFEETINWELRPDALREWDEPKARQRALEDLLKRIGGARRRLTRSKLFRHPALEFKSQRELLARLRKWIPAISESRSDDFPSDEEYPRLWQVFDRILRNRVQFVSDDLLIEANAQRLMLLSAYVAIQLQLPVGEALALIEKAKGPHLILGWSSDLPKRYLTSNSRGTKPKPGRRRKR